MEPDGSKECGLPGLTGASGLNCPHLRFWSGPADRAGSRGAGRGGRSQLSSPALPSPPPLPRLFPVPKGGDAEAKGTGSEGGVCDPGKPTAVLTREGWGSAFPFVS